MKTEFKNLSLFNFYDCLLQAVSFSKRFSKPYNLKMLTSGKSNRFKVI